MAQRVFRLDYEGVGKILTSDAFAARVNELGRKIADEVGDDAEFSEYTTDRRAASVSVPAHRQARDGALTRAASSAGLEVRVK